MHIMIVVGLLCYAVVVLVVVGVAAVVLKFGRLYVCESPGLHFGKLLGTLCARRLVRVNGSNCPLVYFCVTVVKCFASRSAFLNQ